ncbi:sterol desaturase family protein [Psychroserpens sp. AS72]|uniref:sterol desaturase family protein n=1 Tax=Psychroserpens sp. AS72 TaxID=3135775 RepID=UPI00317A568C
MEYLISNFGIIQAVTIAISIVFLRYLFFSGILYSIFYLFKKQRFKHKRIQKKFPKLIRIKKEIKHSFSTAIVFTGIGLCVYALKINDLTKIYTDLSLYGSGYFFLSILIILLLHDSYFYWIHRFIHHPKLFAIFHKVHHQSRNPTPFTAFSFDVTEAIIEAAIIPVIILFLPMHPLAIFIFFNISLGFNIMGHLGYEFLPSWFIKHPILKWINTSTHHNMHHQKANANYGLYFNFWDTLMKTNHKHYHKKFYAITRKNKKTSITD